MISIRSPGLALCGSHLQYPQRNKQVIAFLGHCVTSGLVKYAGFGMLVTHLDVFKILECMKIVYFVLPASGGMVMR